MYGNICGYTQEDIERDFVSWLDGIDMDRLKQWYNGYKFLGDKVYNPFDVLLYLKNRQLKNYWFETGTPDFLVGLMKSQNFSLPELESMYSTDDLMNKFDTNNLIIEGFFFQTGYLTIKENIVFSEWNGKIQTWISQIWKFNTLSSTLSRHLFSKSTFSHHLQEELIKGILEGRPELFEEPLQQFLASIPFDWYKFSKMDKYEGYWASLIYSVFATLGVQLRAEDTTNKGRIDLSLRHENHIFLIELK